MFIKYIISPLFLVGGATLVYIAIQMNNRVSVELATYLNMVISGAIFVFISIGLFIGRSIAVVMAIAVITIYLSIHIIVLIVKYNELVAVWPLFRDSLFIITLLSLVDIMLIRSFFIIKNNS